jgi:LPXTG-motif cell wall-anchored protein
VLAACAGVFFALLPVVASAQEGSRSLDPPVDWAHVMLFTFAGIIGVMLASTLIYLYRRRRNIVWDFQQPEAPHDAHEAAH